MPQPVSVNNKEVIRSWEGPLWEVPLYMFISLYIMQDSQVDQPMTDETFLLKIKIYLSYLILSIYLYLIPGIGIWQHWPILGSHAVLRRPVGGFVLLGAVLLLQVSGFYGWYRDTTTLVAGLI